MADLKKINDDLTDINTSLLNITEAYKKNRTSLADLTGSTRKLGAAWSIVTRATEALAPSISKALFSLRSLTFVAKYFQLSREEAAENDQKILELAKTLNKERVNAVKLIEQLGKAEGERAKVFDKETIYQNKQIAYLIESLGFTEGIAEARRRAEEIAHKTFKLEEKTQKVERNRLYMANDFSKVRGMDIDKVATAMKHQERLSKLESRAMSLKMAIVRAQNDEDKEALRIQQERVLISLEEQKIVAKAAKDRAGYDIIQNPDGTFTTGKAPDKGDPLIEGLKNFQKGIAKKFDGLSKFFSGPSLKILGSFIASGAIIFGKVLLFVAVLGALVYVLHRSGVIDGIKNFFSNEVNIKFLKDTFLNVFESIKKIGMAAFDIIKNVFNIFKILFTGEGDLLDAVGRLLGSIVKFALVAIGQMLKIYGNLFLGLLVVSIGLIVEIASAAITKGIERATENFNRIFRIDPNDERTLRQKGSDRLAATSPGFAIARGAYRQIAGRAMGGPANGLTLVGERGPEIVKLPPGSFVHSNDRSRQMMGNTINVHVNGRIGASEQELNDLAKKLGEKINREMNRFGGLGIRA